MLHADTDAFSFAGLVIMGRPMAGHLLAAGHRLTLHTCTRPTAETLPSAGAVWAGTPAAVGAHLVFLCLPDTPDVAAVLLGAGGWESTRGAGPPRRKPLPRPVERLSGNPG